MTIIITTSATTTCNAIKPSISKMSNIRNSVVNIQHTRHTRSTNIARLITNDKHPPLIISFYYKYNKFFSKYPNFLQIFLKYFNAVSMLYNCQCAVDSRITICICFAAVCYHSCCQCDNKNDRHKLNEIFHKHYLS